MQLLRLSIHQTYGQIGIETHWASQEIESPPGQLSIHQEPARMSIHSEPGTLTIDSSDAWAAYAKGGHLRWENYIYSQMKEVVLRGIAKIVEDGKRMADITNPTNAFADLAKDWMEGSGINYVEPASLDNVKIDYQPHQTQIEIQPQKADIEYEPQKPNIQYIPGDVSIYLRQKQSIDIHVSEYNWYL